MGRVLLASAVSFLLGLGAGALWIGGAAPRPGVPALDHPNVRAPSEPHLSCAIADSEVQTLRQELAAREGTIRDLQERVRDLSEKHNDVPLGDVEDTRQAIVAHYAAPQFSSSELFDEASRSFQSADRFQTLVVSLHDNDVNEYLRAVWANRQALIQKNGPSLTSGEAAAVRRIFVTRWLEFREWARSTYLPAVSDARSSEELRSLNRSRTAHLARTLADLASDARKALDDTDTFQRVAPYL